MARNESYLTAKQQNFCKEYVLDFNATRAAKAVGYSEISAAESGSENLMNSKVQDYIKKITKSRFEKLDISVDDLVLELKAIAFSDLRKTMSWHGDGINLINSEDLEDDAAAFISEVIYKTTKDGGQVGIKMHDKVAAIDKLIKMAGGYNEVGTSENPFVIKNESLSDLTDAELATLESIAAKHTSSNKQS